MQSGIVLYLGMARRGEFEALQRHGLTLGILVDTNNKQKLGDVSKFAIVDRFDFSRPLPELIDAVREIGKRVKIECLFNVIEFYVAQTAQVAQALGLPGISPASARLCLDKSLMRQRFAERIGPKTPARFKAISSEDDLIQFADSIGYPVFLQPANVSASMWATRNADQPSLLASYRQMRDEVPKYYERLGKKGTELVIVAAEFLEGRNTSIDCVIEKSGKVHTTPAVDVLTGRDIGIEDYHHFARIVPSSLSNDEQGELTKLAIAGVQALDMTGAAAHVEFIGRRLGEIGARPGGNRPRILEMAYGIDLLTAYYQALNGQSPNLKPQHQRSAAIITPFAPRTGVLRQIRHLDRLVKLPGYLYHEVRAQPGQVVGLSSGGYRAPLYVELLSDALDEVRRGVSEIASWTDLYELE